jgi:hypothetical protein
MNRKSRLLLILALGILFSFVDCGGEDRRGDTNIVGEVDRELPHLPAVTIAEPEKFLNDIKLSPCWKVERTGDGAWVAWARVIMTVNDESSLAGDGARFLFQAEADPRRYPEGSYRFANHYMEAGEVFSSLSVRILFTNPGRYTGICENERVRLKIVDELEKAIGPNSDSSLGYRLDPARDVWFVIDERGRDPRRASTFALLPIVVNHLARLARLPARYRMEERYRSFFRAIMGKAKAPSPAAPVFFVRVSGLQDRDDFYGVFRTIPATSYEGINIRVSHPVYCNGECTRDSARLAKAEYLGVPYDADDLLFFCLEDNAVYLTGDYDEQFGTFSGKGSFVGQVDVLNIEGKVLFHTEDRFRGWER